MILLNKKRIILFVLTILLSIIIYLLFFNNSEVNKVASLYVSNVDLDKKTVIIDPGHGLPDQGASSSDGVTEADINLKISMKLKEKLENNNFNVILTRENENGIYDSTAKTIREMKNLDLKNRVKIGNNSNADIFVSIHLNQIDQTQYWGWQTFYKKSNEQGKLLAECIQRSITEEISDRQNKREALSISNKYLIDNLKIPATIVECGFLSNVEEATLLQQDEYQNRLVNGIYNGILKYFEQN